MQGSSHDRDWFDERVEPYVDGDLSGPDLLAFQDRLDGDDELREKVRVAGKIATSLRELPTFSVSESMIRNAMNQNPGSPNSDTRDDDTRGMLRLVSSPVAWASLAAAAAIVFAIVLLPTQVTTDEPDQVNVSQAEVEQALAEVKWALALVSDIGNERSEIVNGGIVAPVQKAMSYVITTDDAREVIQ